MRRLVPAAAAALLGSALTAAAITVPAWAEGEEDSPDRLQRWEQCMREQGFDVGGSTVIRVTDDGVTIDGEEVDAERFRAAEARCGLPFALPPDVGELPDRGELRELPRLPLEKALDDLLAPEPRGYGELPDLGRLPLEKALDELLPRERRDDGDVPGLDELPDAFGELEDFFGAPPESGERPERELLPRLSPFLPFGLDELLPEVRPFRVEPGRPGPELPEELLPPLRCVEVAEA